jgi:hypothetical protein
MNSRANGRILRRPHHGTGDRDAVPLRLRQEVKAVLRRAGCTERLPPNTFWEHNNSCFGVESQRNTGGVKGEKPTGFLTDFLLTVSDSYSALQRF